MATHLCAQAPTDTVPGSPFVVVESVLIEGNRRTLPHIITRELTLRPGDTIAVRRLEKVLQRQRNQVFNTRLFVTVDVVLDAPLPPDSMPAYVRRGVRVIVEERWYIFPSVIFELADRNFNEWWTQRGRDLSRTNYGLRVSWRNVRGRNERLKFKLQGGFTQKYELRYEIPYLNRRQRAGGGVLFQYITQKNVAFALENNQLQFLDGEEELTSRLQAGLTYRRREGLFATHEVGLAYFRTEVADTIAALNPDYFLRGRTLQRYTQMTYHFEWDRRDVQAYPLRGFVLMTEASLEGILPSDNLRRLTLNGTYARHVPLGRQFYAAGQVGGGVTIGNRQPFYNNRALGYGRRLIRGYELFVVNGRHYGLLKGEVRKRLFSVKRELNFIPIRQFRTFPLSIYVKTYGDVGFVRDSSLDNPLVNRTLGGGGIGIDVVTFYDVVFRTEFSVNDLGDTGLFVAFKAGI
ncbi:MAG: BamA/TamA family outer membrane protein [Catalinimonas sp.]